MARFVADIEIDDTPRTVFSVPTGQTQRVEFRNMGQSTVWLGEDVRQVPQTSLFDGSTAPATPQSGLPLLPTESIVMVVRDGQKIQGVRLLDQPAIASITIKWPTRLLIYILEETGIA